MPNLPKLNERIAVNQPAIVTLKNRGKAYDNKFNPGTKQYQYFVEHEGIECVHFASEREEEDLRNYQPGEQLQVVLKQDPGMKYPMRVWTPVEGAEARAAATPSIGNTTADTHQRNQAKVAEAREQKETEIGLRGLMQAHITAGRSNQEAIDLALEADAMVRKAAIEKTIF